MELSREEIIGFLRVFATEMDDEFVGSRILLVGGSAMSVFELFYGGTGDIDFLEEKNGRLVLEARRIASEHGYERLFDGSAKELSGILPEVAWSGEYSESWGWLPEDNPRLEILAANHKLLTIMKFGAIVDMSSRGMAGGVEKHWDSIRFLEERHGKWLRSGEEAIEVLRACAPYVTSQKDPAVLERVAKSLFG